MLKKLPVLLKVYCLIVGVQSVFMLFQALQMMCADGCDIVEVNGAYVNFVFLIFNLITLVGIVFRFSLSKFIGIITGIAMIILAFATLYPPMDFWISGTLSYNPFFKEGDNVAAAITCICILLSKETRDFFKIKA